MQPTENPSYELIQESLLTLGLFLSPSLIHGKFCGFLCAGAIEQGESFLKELLKESKKKSKTESVLRHLFVFYVYTQFQLNQEDFSFELFLPQDDWSIQERAQAFSEWCAGFIETFISASQLQELSDEDEEVIAFLKEFSQLDAETLRETEDEERALFELETFAKLAVLQLKEQFSDDSKRHNSDAAH